MKALDQPQHLYDEDGEAVPHEDVLKMAARLPD